MLKLTIQLIIAMHVFNCHLQSNALFARKTMQVNRFLGKCPGYKNVTYWIDWIKFSHVNGTLIINSKMTVTEEISKNVKLMFTLNRCKSREALDTCETYPDITISTMCSVINMNLPPFNQIFNNIQPKFECPTKKGAYRVVNATADEKLLALFPMENVYVYAYIYFLDKINGSYKTIACFYAEGKLIVAT